MKKFFINFLLIISFLIIYLLQVNLFPNITIAGRMPSLFVIYVLFIGLFYSRTAGIAYGIVFGLLIDLFIGRKVGISAIMLGLIGLIGGVFDKNFSKESRLTIMIMVIVSTIIYEMGSYLIGHFIYDYTLEMISFMKILLVESLYNVIITIILYPLMKNLGYKIEEEYKGNKILTRYF